MDNKRRYLKRRVCQGVTLEAAFIDAMSPVMSINKMVNDPFITALDFESGRQREFVPGMVTSVNMFFGLKWQSGKGLFRIGDRITFGNRVYDVLVGDRDEMYRDAWYYGSHPDSEGVTYENIIDDALNMIQQWRSDATSRRGPWDMNFTANDHSVYRYREVRHDDDRSVYLPHWSCGSTDNVRQTTTIPETLTHLE